jgi:hypothetical protein
MMKRTLFATLSGTALAAAMSTASAATIGLKAPLSGPQALVGQDQVDGFLLALEQRGGKLGGQPVTVVKEDDQLKPEVGQQAVRKLIDKDKVDVIVGLSFSNEGLAPLIREEIWQTLGKLKREGLAQIVIDKNVGRLRHLADRHIVIEKGRVVWHGDSDALRSQPDIVYQYLGV